MFKIISKLILLKISLIQDFLNYKLYFSFNLSSLYLKDIFENTSILIFDEIIFDVYICDDILFFISALNLAVKTQESLPGNSLLLAFKNYSFTYTVWFCHFIEIHFQHWKIQHILFNSFLTWLIICLYMKYVDIHLSSCPCPTNIEGRPGSKQWKLTQT